MNYMPITTSQIRSHLTRMNQPIPAGLKGRKSVGGFRSKWEADYKDYLTILVAAGEIKSFQYEAVRLNIGIGAWFKCDFLVQENDGSLSFREVKGFERAAAMVRIKSAAKQFPWWKFSIVKKVDGKWMERAVA